MKLAEQMNKLTNDVLNNDLEILKESILRDVKFMAEYGLFQTDRTFYEDVPEETKNSLVEYLSSEGFSVALVDNNKTLFVAWDTEE